MSFNQSENNYSSVNMNDIREGLRLTPIWWRWAWLEVKQRYRRSVIGNLWITLNLAVLIAGMGVVFSVLFKQDPEEFLPYICVSMVTWQLIAAFINDGCELFIKSRGSILQFNVPLSIHIFRHLARTFINFGHMFLVVMVLIAVMPVPINWNTLLFIPALFVFMLNGFWVAIIFGVFSLRYRDMPMLISNLVQVCFFVTPIFWKADLLGSKIIIASVNPFYHFLEILRQPLLGQVPQALSYYITFAMTISGVIISLWIWSKKRQNIPYWV